MKILLLRKKDLLRKIHYLDRSSFLKNMNAALRPDLDKLIMDTVAIDNSRTTAEILADRIVDIANVLKTTTLSNHRFSDTAQEIIELTNRAEIAAQTQNEASLKSANNKRKSEETNSHFATTTSTSTNKVFRQKSKIYKSDLVPDFNVQVTRKIFNNNQTLIFTII